LPWLFGWRPEVGSRNAPDIVRSTNVSSSTCGMEDLQNRKLNRVMFRFSAFRLFAGFFVTPGLIPIWLRWVIYNSAARCWPAYFANLPYHILFWTVGRVTCVLWRTHFDLHLLPSLEAVMILP
jgi:hypothetical protein